MLDGLHSLVEAKAAVGPKKLVAEGNNGGSRDEIVYLYMFPIPAAVEEMILLAEVKQEDELRDENRNISVDFEGEIDRESGIGDLGFFEDSSDWVLV